MHGRQGSQGLVLGWILRNRKRHQQWRRAGEVATTMASLPAKNYHGGPENKHKHNVSSIQHKNIQRK
jgi:hypothetical protein